MVSLRSCMPFYFKGCHKSKVTFGLLESVYCHRGAQDLLDKPLQFTSRSKLIVLQKQLCTCVLSCFSHVQFFATLWTVACQAPLSMGFSRQGYWSGLPFPSPGDLPHLGIEPVSLKSPALAGRFFPTSATWKDLSMHSIPIRG